MTTRQVSGILLVLIGGFGLMMAFFGMVAEVFALVPFGLLGLLLFVVGIVLIATGGRPRPGAVRRRRGGYVGGGSGGAYHVHDGSSGWYAENDSRGYDDSGRGSSGWSDSGSSSDSGWSGGGWSGGDSGGSSSGGDSGSSSY